MILDKQDSIYAATKLMEYFKDFGRIDDYFRARKIERVKDIPAGLPGMSIEDDLFQDYDMHPEDMNFQVVEIPNKVYDTLLEKTASFSPDENPGKTLKKRAIMGFHIVAAQPFGYNCLGGKLLAAICCSHATRRMLNKKYDTEFCLFETTSLYGNLKGASMYDGMKPYLRYKGDTQSKFLLTLGEDIYMEMRDWFTERNGGEDLIHKGASSRKLKMQTKMVGTIKSSLKQHDTKAYELFTDAMNKAGEVTTQKRFYSSTYGYDNARDVLLGKTNLLTKAENYDRFELDAVIAWWKKLATKRYNKMVAEGRLRRELEVWNQDTMNKIDIIR